MLLLLFLLLLLLLLFVCYFIFCVLSFGFLSHNQNYFLSSFSFSTFFTLLRSLFFAAIFCLNCFLFASFLPSIFVFVHLSFFFPLKVFIGNKLISRGTWSCGGDPSLFKKYPSIDFCEYFFLSFHSLNFR